ncbi:YhfG family protein [Vibrio atlanticus]|uniref:YhfG family protein n=1 Tax=Vibrio atlanticus TaxID=693153 RepID=A0ABV4KYH0_9VIBR
MNVLITKILGCKSVEELKLLDSYLGLKRSVEDKLGFKLHVKGWESFFNRIEFLKSLVSKSKKKLERIPDAKPFVEAKREVNNILGFKINVKERSKLKEILSSLISVFSQVVISAHERFESTKIRNFVHSSRLEGIDISNQMPEESLESILAKYRVKHG